MQSESARMSSTAEARFRIQSTIPTTRVVSVVALDRASDAIVEQLATRSGNRAAFFTTPALSGRAAIEEMTTADLVVMIAAAGSDADAAAAIGRSCSEKRVVTTTVVVRNSATTDDALSRTLASVRPWSLMVVIASDSGYVDDILKSFR